MEVEVSVHGRDGGVLFDEEGRLPLDHDVQHRMAAPGVDRCSAERSTLLYCRLVDVHGIITTLFGLRLPYTLRNLAQDTQAEEHAERWLKRKVRSP